jgi:hypothetical protein
LVIIVIYLLENGNKIGWVDIRISNKIVTKVIRI